MYISFNPADNQKYFVLPIPCNFFVELNANLICKKADCCSMLLNVSQMCSRCYHKRIR